jgi:hypothetical protein
MSAKNISSEKMNSAGMSGGKASESNPVVRKLTKDVKPPTHGHAVGKKYASGGGAKK